MHTIGKKIEKKDISISGEEIFLPTSPETIGEEEEKKQEMSTTIDYEPLPTKPEDIE